MQGLLTRDFGALEHEHNLQKKKMHKVRALKEDIERVRLKKAIAKAKPRRSRSNDGLGPKLLEQPVKRNSRKNIR